MGAFFALALGLMLVLQEWDLTHRFDRVPGWEQVLILVLAPLLAFCGTRYRAASSRLFNRILFILSLLSVSLAGLAASHEVAATRVISRWPTGSEKRLRDSANKTRLQFRRFLSDFMEASKPWSAADPNQDRLAQFRRLREMVAARRAESDRYGWTLWQGDSVVAWAGRTTPFEKPPPGAGREQVFWMQARGASLSLFASSRFQRGTSLVGEYLLQSPLEKRPYLPLPALEEAQREDRVKIAPNPPPGTADVDAAVFNGQPEDLHWGDPRQRRTNLFFPLRDPSGQILAVVNLRDAREDSILQRLTSRDEAVGLLLSAFALLLTACLFYRGAGIPNALAGGLRFASASGSLWTARALLLPIASLLPGSGAFGYDRFASTLGGGLFQSPADLLLTSLFLGVQVSWWDRSLGSPHLEPGARRRLGLVTLPFLVLGALALFLLGSEAPRNSRFDLLHIEFVPPDWVKLMVQTGFFLLFGAWLAAARTALRSLRGRSVETVLRRPARLPWVARLYGFTCLATLLYFPAMGLLSNRQRARFFARELLPEVVEQHNRRRDLLKGVLEQIRESSSIHELLQTSPSGPAEGLAYRVWSATVLKDLGLSSSLRVLSEEGHLISRFGLNFSASLEEKPLPPREEGGIRVVLARLGSSRQRVLLGEIPLELPRGGRLTVQVHLLDEYENLSFIRADNIYVQLFRGSRPQQTNPELLGSEPLIALYHPDGALIYSNLEGGPALPPRLRERLAPGRSRWVPFTLGDDRYQALVKRSADRILAIGFLLPSPLEQVGGFVRVTLLGFLASLVFAGIFALRPGTTTLYPQRRGRFLRRLLAFFLVGSFTPLLSLAFFLHRFALREIDEDLVSEGLASLGAASRIVEDYLASPPGSEETPLRDDVAFWLSKVVRQDINLYAGDRLFATSTRELYASGLLSTRLDGHVYESLALRGETYVLNEERLADLEYLTIAAPISLGDGTHGVLSLPLALKKREILRKRADVEEVILIATVAMLLLLTVLAYHLARRISEPISALAEAARRIEGGDYDAEVRIVARDETALLIDSFNRMAASLRKQREDLRRRRDYIEKILLHATTGVISTDPGGRVVTLNPAARVLLGLSDPHPEGAELLSLLDRSEGLGPLRKALAASHSEKEKTWQVSLPTGEKPVSLRIVSLPFREAPDSQAGRILLLEDLTETVRSSRLEAWADMARRIAHEIKNPLTPIQLSADHLRKVYRSGDPRFEAILEQCLDTIQNQVRALRGIAVDFSDYARIPRLRPEKVSAAEILDEALTPYRVAPPPGIQVETQIERDVPLLFVDRTLTCRALVNLVENALDAMPEGGTLAVAAERGSGAREVGRPRVRIRVRDTGVGMDSETRARLFEPYFSTKSAGTGLGLSIVRKTTEEQGGTVEVHSSPGSGTEVILELPGAAPE